MFNRRQLNPRPSLVSMVRSEEVPLELEVLELGQGVAPLVENGARAQKVKEDDQSLEQEEILAETMAGDLEETLEVGRPPILVVEGHLPLNQAPLEPQSPFSTHLEGGEDLPLQPRIGKVDLQGAARALQASKTDLLDAMSTSGVTRSDLAQGCTHSYCSQFMTIHCNSIKPSNHDMQLRVKMSIPTSSRRRVDINSTIGLEPPAPPPAPTSRHGKKKTNILHLHLILRGQIRFLAQSKHNIPLRYLNVSSEKPRRSISHTPMPIEEKKATWEKSSIEREQTTKSPKIVVDLALSQEKHHDYYYKSLLLLNTKNPIYNSHPFHYSPSLSISLPSIHDSTLYKSTENECFCVPSSHHKLSTIE